MLLAAIGWTRKSSNSSMMTEMASAMTEDTIANHVEEFIQNRQYMAMVSVGARKMLAV
jgi:DNA phosphorothioation-dependent restriction protein DptG